MQLKTDVQSSFLNLFTKAMENEPLERDNKMNLFVLKAKNNCFDYGALTESLKDQLIFYALSRHTVDELVSKRDFGKMSSYAREKLRKAEQNTGAYQLKANANTIKRKSGISGNFPQVPGSARPCQ